MTDNTDTPDEDDYALEDSDDIFSDNFRSARAGSRVPGDSLPTPLAEMTDEQIAELNAKHRSIRNRKKSTRRRLEAHASNRIRNHLFKTYGAVTTRVNAGQWLDDAGNTIMGAKPGTSDILACVPIRIGAMTFGVYFAFEVKSTENRSDGTEAQQSFITRVKNSGGAGGVVRTVLDVDAVIDAKRRQMIEELRQFVHSITKP